LAFRLFVGFGLFVFAFIYLESFGLCPPFFCALFLFIYILQGVAVGNPS